MSNRLLVLSIVLFWLSGIAMGCGFGIIHGKRVADRWWQQHKASTASQSVVIIDGKDWEPQMFRCGAIVPGEPRP